MKNIIRLVVAFIMGLFNKKVESEIVHYVADSTERIFTQTLNKKDLAKRAAIKRRHKARKLASLSKSKRRAVYCYNLRHPASKMYA